MLFYHCQSKFHSFLSLRELNACKFVCVCVLVLVCFFRWICRKLFSFIKPKTVCEKLFTASILTVFSYSFMYLRTIKWYITRTWWIQPQNYLWKIQNKNLSIFLNRKNSFCCWPNHIYTVFIHIKSSCWMWFVCWHRWNLHDNLRTSKILNSVV